MASRGMFFGEGPSACPFVALENDRDRRSDEPDHRHRCYAEPDPAPRALAHQREYCLAAAFTACPIFQDWAIRAAATPVPLRPGRMPDIERDPEPAWAAPPPWFADEPEAGAAEPENGQAAAEGEPAAEGFVAPPAREAGAEATDAALPPNDIERLASLPVDDARPPRTAGLPLPPVPPRQPQTQAPQPPDDQPEPGVGREQPPAPAFLADRAERAPARASAAPPERPQYVEPRRQQHSGDQPDRALPSEKLRREDVVPSWGREPQHALHGRPKVNYGDSGSWVSRITTLLAIAVILSLAVVAIILAPSLLGGGGSPTRTLPAAGSSPSLRPATPTPRPTPTAAPTPVSYTVQPGDTLFSIALRHGLTVEQLLAANPQITNPDLVTIGQQIIIPGPDFDFPSPTPEES